MLARLTALLHRFRDLAATDAITERELADLGLTRAQLRALVAIPADVPDRVARMAALFGLTAQDLQENRADYVELLSTCQHCRDSSTCRREFSEGRLVRPADAGFCPNAAVYAARAA